MENMKEMPEDNSAFCIIHSALTKDGHSNKRTTRIQKI